MSYPITPEAAQPRSSPSRWISRRTTCCRGAVRREQARSSGNEASNTPICAGETSSPSAGVPVDGAPEGDGFGRIVSGFLESSNVSVAEELTALVVASRAYQMNLMAYRTIREMLEAANELTA